MILIDATYINSFGGKSIFESILLEMNKKKIKNLYFLLDNRLKLDFTIFFSENNYTVIKSTHFKRYFFYKKNLQKFDAIVCLSNIPPPYKNSVKTTIFFHNRLFLKPLTHTINFKEKLINYIKFQYIKFFKQENYYWVVQTKLMKDLIKNSLNVNFQRVLVFPIFNYKHKTNQAYNKTSSFVYVSSGVSHKNHNYLILAFIFAASKTTKKIKLLLTLHNEQLPKYVFPKNLKIEFYGTLSKDSVSELYDSCAFAIYPSLVESFGLPLIEAANHGCKVIASDLPYVHEIIRPSLTFDPYSVESISDSILKAMETDNLPETKVLVENKLDNFIDFIISQDVQK